MRIEIWQMKMILILDRVDEEGKAGLCWKVKGEKYERKRDLLWGLLISQLLPCVRWKKREKSIV